MKPARLVYGGPISEKLKAASRALDEQVASGRDEMKEASRERWIASLVRLYQSCPEQSRLWLRQYNAKPDRMHHDLGPDVRDRLIMLGIIDKGEGK